MTQIARLSGLIICSSNDDCNQQSDIRSHHEVRYSVTPVGYKHPAVLYTYEGYCPVLRKQKNPAYSRAKKQELLIKGC